jgi:hypothetical protein
VPQNFIAYDRDQELLLPPDWSWLPKNHLAWFVLAAVEEIDLYPPELSTEQGRRGWLREAKQRLEAERAANPISDRTGARKM